MLEETEQALFKEDYENINLYSALKKCFIYLFILTKLLFNLFYMGIIYFQYIHILFVGILPIMIFFKFVFCFWGAGMDKSTPIFSLIFFCIFMFIPRVDKIPTPGPQEGFGKEEQIAQLHFLPSIRD